MKHLIYHITPIDTPEGRLCWKWHLRQVQKYAGIFDGQRIFAVGVGPGLAPYESVLELLPPKSQVILAPNHTELRDCYTLALLLARTYSTSPADAVFYAHAKGVSWVGHPYETATRWWSLAMYRWLLSDEAMNMLQTSPFVGWLKCEGTPAMFPMHSFWHYSGTFWWFRALDVYARPWWVVHPSKYGSEAYPSGLFPTEAAACRYRLALPDFLLPNGVARLYDLELWKQLGIPTGADADGYDGSPA